MSASLDDLQAFGVAGSGIGRVAVIGAGAMGGGIAAQFANAGVEVDLLDVAAAEGDRNAAAKAGVARQIKIGGFMHEAAAALVRPGNVDDDLERLAQTDWIIEAIVERLDLKQALYARIETVRKPGSIVSSNTSTIRRADLVAGRSADFAASFFVTHFFNPPRMMQLAELVSVPGNDPALAVKVAEACTVVLGKTIIDCRDTPGFIANRVGCYWIAAGIIEAQRMGLRPEAADATMTALGVPRTGVFGLADLVGLDLIPTVWGSLMSTLPGSDALHGYDLPNDPLTRGLIEAGRFGRKSKAGFYSLGTDRQLGVVDYTSGDYRAAEAVDPKALPGGGRDLPALLASDRIEGRYARRVFCALVNYAAEIGPDIAADVAAIDAAMELGYGWKEGPFKLADRVGLATLVEWVHGQYGAVPDLLARAAQIGRFYDADGVPLSTDGASHHPVAGIQPLSLARLRETGKPILGNDAASLWDLGDGIAGFEMHTKLNSFAPAVFDVLEQALDLGGTGFAALVLGNDDPRAFSVGADLSAILSYVADGRLDDLGAYIERGQRLFRRMRFSPFPVVAAMHGLALGGGCEFGLHAHRIVAHAELNAGLPEVLVGLVPGWGGCTQLLVNAQLSAHGPKGPVATAQRAFGTILSGSRSSSAADARVKGVLRETDIVVMNRDRLLDATKSTALTLLADGFTPPAETALVLPGTSGKAALMNEVLGERAAGRMSDIDVAIAEVLATVVTGGNAADPLRPLSEADLLGLELEALIELAGRPSTATRIEHMLKTGKPLRN